MSKLSWFLNLLNDFFRLMEIRKMIGRRMKMRIVMKCVGV